MDTTQNQLVSMNIKNGTKMGIFKKFNDFITSKSLDQYLLENQDKYLQLIEEMKPDEGQIYITYPNNSDKLYRIGSASEKLKNWRYFDGYKKEIFYIKSEKYSTNILQIKEVDKFKDTTILITKPIKLNLIEVKEALQRESGYIWSTIEELMFHTFNNDPQWGFSHLTHYESSGMIVLEISNYDLKSRINNNPNDRIEFEKYIEWVKNQLQIITGRPFKVFIDLKSNSTPRLNGGNIKFTLDYPRL